MEGTWDESFEIYKNSGNMIFLFKIFFIFSQNICMQIKQDYDDVAD